MHPSKTNPENIELYEAKKVEGPRHTVETTVNARTGLQSTTSIQELLKNVKDFDGVPYINSDGTLHYSGEEYYQGAQAETKGAIQWDEEGKAIINLFKGADASTVIHETGHYFVEVFMKESALENADPKLKKDRAALLEYVGMTEEEWNNADMNGRRAAHERLAEGFETYIIEGKAPTRELRSVFRRFSNWLKAVYSSIVNQETKEKAYDPSKRNANAAELTPEVRAVFDRMLATEEEIKAVERIDGYFAGLPKIMTDNLNQKYQDRLKDYIAAAHDKAVEILTKQAMANFSAERRAAIKAFRQEVRAQAEAEVAEQKVYAAQTVLRDVLGKVLVPSKIAPL